jgi:lipoic acid synthetase
MKCTRRCSFCAVEAGTPLPPDPTEPERLASVASDMGLRFVVLTSVTRDDLPDGGASHFAASIRALKTRIPGVRAEALVPDFNGKEEAVAAVQESGADVFAHNAETVRRLYRPVRPGALYDRTLYVLRQAKLKGAPLTKSGVMLGLGEQDEEVLALLRDLREALVDIVTIGQYLRPTRSQLPVVEYVRPEKFEFFAQEARQMGFRLVVSGPLVRSSYRAEEAEPLLEAGASASGECG